MNSLIDRQESVKIPFDTSLATSLLQFTQVFFNQHAPLGADNISFLESELLNFTLSPFAKKVQHQFMKQGCCIIQNLPVDDVKSIPSPMPAEMTFPSTPLACIILTWLFQMIGMGVCGIEYVRNGALFHNIVPTQEKEGLSQINDAAWGRHLGYHQEMAFLNRPGLCCAPHVLGLLCLRGGFHERPVTYLVCTQEILAKLDNRLIEILKMPIFTVRAPEFIPWISKPQPLYYPSIENPEIYCLTYSNLYTGQQPTVSISTEACQQVGMTIEEARSCLAALNHAYETTSTYAIIFEQGDCILIDNRFIHHARSRFELKNPDRHLMRWLLRAYGVSYAFLPKERLIRISTQRT